MGVRKDPSGPLINSTLFQIGEVIFWGTTVQPTIEALDDDEVYIVKNYDRIDLIAHNRMGNSQLGWVILARNGLRLAPNDLVPGMKLFIPTHESLSRRGIVQ